MFGDPGRGLVNALLGKIIFRLVMTAPDRAADAARSPRTRVDDIYEAVKEMAVAYRLKPGERLNEMALAKDLGASRTPLREALNRLVAERLLDFVAGRGFFCRGLDAREVFELYEVRRTLEVEAVRLACRRAGDAAISALAGNSRFYDWQVFGQPIQELVGHDEAFHLQIAELTDNRELLHQLQRINERTRFIRWLDMDRRVEGTKAEHRGIVEALAARDEDLAAEKMRRHIERRQDQVDSVVREGFSTIYMDDLESPGVKPASAKTR